MAAVWMEIVAFTLCIWKITIKDYNDVVPLPLIGTSKKIELRGNVFGSDKCDR